MHSHQWGWGTAEVRSSLVKVRRKYTILSTEKITLLMSTVAGDRTTVAGDRM